MARIWIHRSHSHVLSKFRARCDLGWCGNIKFQQLVNMRGRKEVVVLITHKACWVALNWHQSWSSTLQSHPLCINFETLLPLSRSVIMRNTSPNPSASIIYFCHSLLDQKHTTNNAIGRFVRVRCLNYKHWLEVKVEERVEMLSSLHIVTSIPTQFLPLTPRNEIYPALIALALLRWRYQQFQKRIKHSSAAAEQRHLWSEKHATRTRPTETGLRTELLRSDFKRTPKPTAWCVEHSRHINQPCRIAIFFPHKTGFSNSMERDKRVLCYISRQILGAATRQRAWNSPVL